MFFKLTIDGVEIELLDTHREPTKIISCSDISDVLRKRKESLTPVKSICITGTGSMRDFECDYILLNFPMSLEELAIKNCGLGLKPNQLGSILTVAKNTHVTSLDLSNNGIVVFDKDMAASLTTTALIILSLAGNEFKDAGVQNITAALPRTLRDLNLGSNGITDVGVGALAVALPRTLRNLNLGSNGITDVGLGALAVALPRTLRSLNLGLNGITDVGVQALVAELPETSFDNLDLSWNRITKVGAQALIAVLPRTFVKSLNLNENRASIRADKISVYTISDIRKILRNNSERPTRIREKLLAEHCVLVPAEHCVLDNAERRYISNPENALEVLQRILEPREEKVLQRILEPREAKVLPKADKENLMRSSDGRRFLISANAAIADDSVDKALKRGFDSKTIGELDPAIYDWLKFSEVAKGTKDESSSLPITISSPSLPVAILTKISEFAGFRAVKLSNRSRAAAAEFVGGAGGAGSAAGGGGSAGAADGDSGRYR